MYFIVVTAVPAAIEYYFRRYGLEQTDQAMSILSQILQNILTDPNNLKYQSLSLKSDKFQRYIGRPIGALVYLIIWMLLFIAFLMG